MRWRNVELSNLIGTRRWLPDRDRRCITCITRSIGRDVEFVRGLGPRDVVLFSCSVLLGFVFVLVFFVFSSGCASSLSPIHTGTECINVLLETARSSDSASAGLLLFSYFSVRSCSHIRSFYAALGSPRFLQASVKLARRRLRPWIRARWEAFL